MKISITLRSLLAPVALLLCIAPPLTAQVLFTQLVSTNPTRFQLRQVNGDGSGETAIGLPFADTILPAWSRDGAFFAVSAPDPNRPGDRSYNVFAINAANGAIFPVTIFEDTRADPQTGTFQFTVAQYKAFSPDRNAMAVSSTIVSGSRGQTTRTTPVLEVYTTASRAAAAIVHVYSERTGITHHAGEGVDWHPSQNVLATPINASSPYLSDPSRSGEVTALFLLDPVDGAVQQGRFRQITFPRADQGSNTQDAFFFGEHDYQPRYSPNGVAVAYVRSFQRFSLNSGGQEPNFQSLRILNLQTGADFEVTRLPQGAYVTGLNWTPDGGALVFDLGQQENGINGLVQNAVPQTIEIYVVNVDGTGVRRLRGAGSATPAWKPLPPGVATPAGSNVVVRSPSGDASVVFPSVSSGGSTTFVPINPASAGAPPAGFTIINEGPANEITTSAAFAGPVTVCQTVSAINDAGTFARLRILHGENGQLVDRTILAPDSPAPNFETRTVCARVNTLSPFVTALAPAPPATPRQLLNIATRLRVRTGENVLIGGVIITGSQPKRVILRAIGPSLAGSFNGALPDTALELFQGDTLLAANNNWRDSQQAEIEGTTIPPSNELESAIVRTLAPGSYTAVLSGAGGATGIGVIEVYDLDQAADSKLANISSRGFVEAGNNVMIGGLIVGGNGSTDARVLIRALGPSLRDAGVNEALADPTLELADGNGNIVRANDEWQESQRSEIEATGIPPSQVAESAIIATLGPGNYTAVVRGKGDGIGVGLVEIYNLP